MKKLILHITLTIAMLCGLCMSPSQAVAQHDVSGEQGRQECVARQDAMHAGNVEERSFTSSGAVLRTGSQYRLSSSRPTRLLPTHGGKPGKNHFRNAENNNPFYISETSHFLASVSILLRKAVPSPRSYYVIALRRLLC